MVPILEFRKKPWFAPKHVMVLLQADETQHGRIVNCVASLVDAEGLIAVDWDSPGCPPTEGDICLKITRDDAVMTLRSFRSQYGHRLVHITIDRELQTLGFAVKLVDKLLEMGLRPHGDVEPFGDLGKYLGRDWRSRLGVED